ncbi:uncharacterized protein LOC134541959 [Bacillus rossius redtenbacheri]|uniref:uncharacterized protein LOC134541959 n=1 Tax=Bacillus rossius redtenbacheri TaxID=93214 RepID=UPI002FDE09F3
MILQTMESQNLSQLVQTEEFLPKCAALAENIDVKKCSSFELNPYFSVGSLHSDFLDIAEMVTVSDSAVTKCGIINVTECVPEIETCSDIYSNGRDLSVEETYFKQSPCADDVPFEVSRPQEVFPTAANNPCEYTSTSVNESPPVLKSMDVSYLACSATSDVFIDAKCFCGICNDCCKMIKSAVFQSKEFSNFCDFPTEIAHVVEISTSVDHNCDNKILEFNRGSINTLQAHEATRSSVSVQVRDSLVLPDSCCGTCKLEVKANNSLISADSVGYLNSQANDKWLTSVAKADMTLTPLVLELREKGVESKDKIEAVCCLTEFQNSVVASSTLNMKMENSSIVQPSVLELYEMRMNSDKKTEVVSFPKGVVNDKNGRWNAIMTNDACLQPTPVLESREVEVELGEKADSTCLTDITNNLDACKLNLELRELKMKSEENNRATLCLTSFTNDLNGEYRLNAIIADDVPKPLSILESFDEKLKPNDDHDYSCKIVATSKTDYDFRLNAVVVDDGMVEFPSALDFYETEQNDHTAYHRNIRNNDNDEHVRNVVAEDSFHLSSPVSKPRKTEMKRKEGRSCKRFSADPGNIENFNASDNFLCSVFKNLGSGIDKSDIELTKHLMQGLCFLTPVRDILKSHRLLSPRTANHADISGNSLFSGFDEVECSTGGSKHCATGMGAIKVGDHLFEEHCGHFSVGSAHTACKNNVDVSSGKKCIRFGSVTIYYFPRAQGFTAISSDGGVALGMEAHHCDVKLLSSSDYAVQKDQQLLRGSHRKHKKKRLSSTPGVDYESHRAVQTLSSHKRTSLLRAAGIRQVDYCAIQEAVMINASRLMCGCFCTDGCVPDVCFCARMEIECLIDREGFPCKCSADSCGNPHGRTTFSPAEVHSHFVATLARLHAGDTPLPGVPSEEPPPAAELPRR